MMRAKQVDGRTVLRIAHLPLLAASHRLLMAQPLRHTLSHARQHSTPSER